VYLFNTCIVVPSLVVITTSYTTYAPAPFPMAMLERRAFPVPPAASPTVDHPDIRTFWVKSGEEDDEVLSARKMSAENMDSGGIERGRGGGLGLVSLEDVDALRMGEFDWEN
jgi:hypothetical protein